MENKLVLKDGSEIIDGFASKSSADRLMIQIPGDNIVAAAIEFSNPNKTETIICYYGIYKTTYKGFTVMYTVQYFKDGDYVEIWLNPAEGVKTEVIEEITVPKEYVPYETSPEAGREEVTENE